MTDLQKGSAPGCCGRQLVRCKQPVLAARADRRAGVSEARSVVALFFSNLPLTRRQSAARLVPQKER